jgi:hypothetical protein
VRAARFCASLFRLVFETPRSYTLFAITRISKTFVEVESMSEAEISQQMPSSPTLPPSSPSAGATSLQTFESTAEYCISVLNSLGGSAVLLLAFAVTAISRYIPPSSCVYSNGRQAVPTEPRPFPIARLNGAVAASFPSCKDYPEKDAFITFAVAAAMCGYIASLHGVCLHTLVSNFMSDSKKEEFMRRMHGTFIAGVLVFFVGVILLFLALAFNGYGIQASRLLITAVNSSTTKWTWDQKPADVPLYICICLSAILM